MELSFSVSLGIFRFTHALLYTTGSMGIPNLQGLPMDGTPELTHMTIDDGWKIYHFWIGNTSTHSWWIFQPVMLVLGGVILAVFFLQLCFVHSSFLAKCFFLKKSLGNHRLAARLTTSKTCLYIFVKNEGVQISGIMFVMPSASFTRNHACRPKTKQKSHEIHQWLCLAVDFKLRRRQCHGHCLWSNTLCLCGGWAIATCYL